MQSVPNDITEILAFLKDQMPSFMSEKMVKTMYAEFNLNEPRIRKIFTSEVQIANVQIGYSNDYYGFDYPDPKGQLQVATESNTWIIRGNDSYIHDYSGKSYDINGLENKLKKIFVENPSFGAQLRYHWKTIMPDFWAHYFQIIKGDTRLILQWNST